VFGNELGDYGHVKGELTLILNICSWNNVDISTLNCNERAIVNFYVWMFLLLVFKFLNIYIQHEGFHFHLVCNHNQVQSVYKSNYIKD
jgi:hypothetical protein